LSSKGSIVGQLQRALAKRDVLAVRSLAGELPAVPLPLAAEITVLLLEQELEFLWLREGFSPTRGGASYFPCVSWRRWATSLGTENHAGA
jgi:hypothetical protein